MINEILLNCSETALKVHWKCSESALKVLWNCSEIALKVLWKCSGKRGWSQAAKRRSHPVGSASTLRLLPSSDISSNDNNNPNRKKYQHVHEIKQKLTIKWVGNGGKLVDTTGGSACVCPYKAGHDTPSAKPEYTNFTFFFFFFLSKFKKKGKEKQQQQQQHKIDIS